LGTYWYFHKKEMVEVFNIDIADGRNDLSNYITSTLFIRSFVFWICSCKSL